MFSWIYFKAKRRWMRKSEIVFHMDDIAIITEIDLDTNTIEIFKFKEKEKIEVSLEEITLEYRGNSEVLRVTTVSFSSICSSIFFAQKVYTIIRII